VADSIMGVMAATRLYLLILGRCDPSQCMNGGKCMGDYSQTCECPSGFEGPNCQFGM